MLLRHIDNYFKRIFLLKTTLSFKNINPLSPSVPNSAHKITPVCAELHKNYTWSGR